MRLALLYPTTRLFRNEFFRNYFVYQKENLISQVMSAPPYCFTYSKLLHNVYNWSWRHHWRPRVKVYVVETNSLYYTTKKRSMLSC